MNAQRPRSRLYLFTPQLDDTTSFAGALDATLAAGDVAAVLLRLGDADERTLINRVKSIGAVVQRRDIALLLDGRPDIVGRAGADGAHLTGIEALSGALGALKPDRIAGVGGLRSRHDAMLAGEANPDYVMFGEPDRRGDQGNRPNSRPRGARGMVGRTFPIALHRLRRGGRRDSPAGQGGSRLRRAR